ncbi:restriction endonuclease subunit S [Chamaesiphon sp.]|uniref:restriction endonuclease subunit S n=1 Tax=Chamaesiphon sp. TaxID=2814140 RepID=UPI003593681A
MSDLSKQWLEKKLGEICNITSSKRIFQSEYIADGIPFYRTKEIKELANGKDVTTELFISEERYRKIKINFGIPIAGDILLTAIGTIGEIYVIEADKEFYFKDGNVLWLKDFKLVNTYYLKLVLGSFVEKLKKLSNGSAYGALSIEKLKNHTILLPPLEEQKRIVKILDRAESLRTMRRQSIEQLNTLTQAIFLEMFGDPVTNPKGWKRLAFGELLANISRSQRVEKGVESG